MTEKHLIINNVSYKRRSRLSKLSASMSSSEESALLEHGDADVYDRFSKAQKHFIVFALSFAALLPSTYELNLKYLTEMIHVLSISVRDWGFSPFHPSDSS